jgi:hypothetical protein
MRMSEAIRLGSMLGPQADGHFYLDGAMCAQGAALAASGFALSDKTHPEVAHNEIRARWPWLDDVVVPCPACEVRQSVRGLIPHLNNGTGPYPFVCGEHGWSREQIADWLETVEPQEAEAPEVVPVLEVVR